MEENKKANSGKKIPKFSFNLYWIYILIFAVFVALQLFNFTGGPQEISMKELLTAVSSGDVGGIEVVNESYALVTLRPDALEKEEFKHLQQKTFGGINKGPHFKIDTGPADKFEEKIAEAQKNLPSEDQIQINYSIKRNIWEGLLGWLLPIGLMVVVWIFLMRRMGGGTGGAQIFNIGKSKAKLFDKDSKVNVTFLDVAGLDEAKVELMEIVEFLKNPKKYTTLGGKIPKGALLIGPPGTGKTLLAKAIAGEAGVPFFSLSGSDFVEMFVGVGASRVRDLFRQAKEKAPCIVFIDEIDAIGRARGRSIIQGANDERENTLNQLLTEMDGFESNSGVIIIAATNRVDILDKALIRPGRFDRQIAIDLPDLNGRKDIFKVHTKGLKIAKDIDLDLLARQTPGFSGADIANVCNEAALIAARNGKNEIQKSDFNDAIDRVIGGLEKKNKIISPEEKRVIAYHEAGHATVSWLLRYASPLVKVTIVPRGQSLGAAWYLPEERQITTYDQIMDELTATMGGRAAEEVIFGKVSTGALSDLERVTKQAYAMVTIFGLNEKIGNVSFYDSSGQSEYALTKPYSEKTAEQIDEEVKRIVEIAYQRALKILRENKDYLIKVAERLIEKEVIYREDVQEILGPRPFESPAHHGAVAENGQNKEPVNQESPLSSDPVAESETQPESTNSAQSGFEDPPQAQNSHT